VRGTEETVVTPAIVAEDATRPVPVVRAADRRSRRRPLVAAIAAVVVVVLVVGLGLVGAALLPGATVTIQPATEAVGPVPYTVGFTEPDHLSGTAEATATVTATGTYEILEPATGTVVLFNWGAFDQAIAAGTLVASGDQAFETQADVVVPGGSLTPQGTIQAGEAPVGVVAAAPGPAGNVGVGAIDTVLSQDADARLQGGFAENDERRVTNPEATSGGVDEGGVQIRQRDVNAAVEALNADLRGQVSDALAEEGDAIVAQSELAEPTIEGLDDLAGTRDQPEATIEGTLEWEAMLVERDTVIDAAVQRLVDDLAAIPASHHILPQSVDVTIQETGVQGVALVVDVAVSARTAPRIDELQVFHRIRGLTRDEAEAALNDLGDATVELWPDWAARVPSMAWRIEVRVAEP
jgi:hypothetical protein